MAISLKTLYESTKNTYQISLLAGEKGMDEAVSWVYLAEDLQTIDFIHGNELIITTGLESESITWLKTLVDHLILLQATGLIVNVGKYIEEVSNEMIAYCNEKGFPLFTIPWEIHLVDIIREFSSLIIEKEKAEWNVSNALEHAIFNSSKIELYETNLQRNGFEVDGLYCVAVIHVEMEEGQDKETLLQRFLLSIRNRLNLDGEKYNIFEKNKEMILIFYQKKQEEVKKYIIKLHQELFKFYPMNPTRIGVGSFVIGSKNLHKSYKRAHSCYQQARKNKEEILCFSDLGMNKLVLSIEDVDLLKEVKEESLGKIIAYDKKHQTDYEKVLRLYIQYNSNIQAVADELFTHRNTINYRMRKIRELLGNNLETMEERCNLYMAFLISDFLK